jgi:hypothetical protein
LWIPKRRAVLRAGDNSDLVLGQGTIVVGTNNDRALCQDIDLPSTVYLVNIHCESKPKHNPN